MTKILILGGGFGGVRAALDLEKKLRNRKDIQIVLVDRNNYHLFTPLLYEVASAHDITHSNHPYHARLKLTVSIPYDRIFKNKKVSAIQAEIKSIDIKNKKVCTEGNNVLDFDYLILGLGSEVSTYSIPGVSEYAYKFKTVHDAVGLYDKIEEFYDMGSRGERTLPINFVVVGGGFTGIELASELSICATHAAHRHKIYQKNCSSTVLAESNTRILPSASDKEALAIKKRVQKLGVNVMENAAVKEVGPDWVKLENGARINADIVVWTAGIKPLELIQKTEGLNTNERGYIEVNDYMQARGFDNIFSIGDNIDYVCEKTGKPVPKMAYTAVDQGKTAADNIVRLIKGGGGKSKLRLKKYKPFYNVWVAPIGGKNAFVHLGSLRFNGFIGHLARQAIDFRYYLTILPIMEAVRLFNKKT